MMAEPKNPTDVGTWKHHGVLLNFKLCSSNVSYLLVGKGKSCTWMYFQI